MSSLYSYLRPALIAIAAMAATLSVGVTASACPAMSAGGAEGGCCDGRAPAQCCCKAVALAPDSEFNAVRAEPRPSGSRGLNPLADASGSAREGSATRVRPLASGRLSVPISPCQCRSSSPSQPASKPRSASGERRTDQDRVQSPERIPQVLHAVASVRLVPPTASPPAAPIYLCTSRLLI
jgi:hypothetical protein